MINTDYSWDRNSVWRALHAASTFRGGSSVIISLRWFVGRGAELCLPCAWWCRIKGQAGAQNSETSLRSWDTATCSPPVQAHLLFALWKVQRRAVYDAAGQGCLCPRHSGLHTWLGKWLKKKKSVSGESKYKVMCELITCSAVPKDLHWHKLLCCSLNQRLEK